MCLKRSTYSNITVTDQLRVDLTTRLHLEVWPVMPQVVPPKMGPPGPSVANYVAMDGPPRTICGAVSGPPLPQMVPLKLSLEMMSRGSYEVNRANIWIV